MFGVVFPNRSFPMDISTFVQIDTFHWVLDMNHFVGKSSSPPPLFIFPIKPQTNQIEKKKSISSLRRSIRPNRRDVHLPTQQLHSPTRQSTSRLRPIPRIRLRLLRRRNRISTLGGFVPAVAGAWKRGADAAHGGGLGSFVGENRNLGGGRGVASVVGCGGGEENRAVGDESWGESV